MTAKKIVGCILIVIALLFTLVIIGSIPKLLELILGIYKIFAGSLDSYEVGKVVGALISWIFYFILTIVLWKYGIRFIKGNSTK